MKKRRREGGRKEGETEGFSVEGGMKNNCGMKEGIKRRKGERRQGEQGEEGE